MNNENIKIKWNFNECSYSYQILCNDITIYNNNTSKILKVKFIILRNENWKILDQTKKCFIN